MALWKCEIVAETTGAPASLEGEGSILKQRIPSGFKESDPNLKFSEWDKLSEEEKKLNRYKRALDAENAAYKNLDDKDKEKYLKVRRDFFDAWEHLDKHMNDSQKLSHAKKMYECVQRALNIVPKEASGSTTPSRHSMQDYMKGLVESDKAVDYAVAAAKNERLDDMVFRKAGNVLHYITGGK